MKLEITTLGGASAGEVELDEAIFGLEPRADLLARCVRWQLAKRRAGTHAVKNRSEINRTTKKLYKQKGTGNARHGAASAPQFRGGGRAFGPQVRSHEHGLPKKVRALALRHALSSKARDATLIVVDEARLDEGKTKALKSTFGQLGLSNALIIAGAEVDGNFGRAARNIPNIDVLPVQGINVYDILRREKLVLTREAVDALEARFGSNGERGPATLKQSSGKEALGDSPFVRVELPERTRDTPTALIVDDFGTPPRERWFRKDLEEHGVDANGRYFVILSRTNANRRGVRGQPYYPADDMEAARLQAAAEQSIEEDSE